MSAGAEPQVIAGTAAMSGNVIETVMGAVVLVVAALFLFFAYTTSQLRAVEGYPVTAQFSRIDGIRDGSDVRIAGVKVGSIVGENLDPKTFLATVKMNINPEYKLPEDTVAEIVSSSLLGDKYMSLDAGRVGQEHPAGRRDQIHPGAGQPRRPDRPDDLFADRGAEEAGRGRRRGAGGPGPAPGGAAPGGAPPGGAPSGGLK